MLAHCTARGTTSGAARLTHVDFRAVKLRLPGRRDHAGTPDDTSGGSGGLTEQLLKAGGKGRPTPKRSVAQGRRTGPPPPPPTTRKEAYKRMRAQQAARRAESRQGMSHRDDGYLPARDRGPARKLVRDIVDSRRNVGNFFLALAVVMLVGTLVPSMAVKNYTSFVAVAYFTLLIVDSFVLGRRIKRTVADRFPGQDHKMKGLVWYGISRSTMIRRWRFPKPEVPLGAEV